MADVFCFDNNIPDYVAKECGMERAGIIGIALFDKSQNPTDAQLQDVAALTYWNSTQSTSPRYVHIIKSTRGEYTGGAPVEEDGFGIEDKQITDAEHTSNIEVEGLLDNWTFWETVNRRKWKVALLTNAGFLLWINRPVTVYAKINNPKNIKANAFWMIALKWADISNPKVLDGSNLTSLFVSGTFS